MSSPYFREKALAKTNHQSVGLVTDDPDIGEPYVAPQGHVLSSTDDQPSGDYAANKEAVASDTSVQAKSLKLDE